MTASGERTCPVCRIKCEWFSTSFSKEGTWCNHAGWVLRFGSAPIGDAGAPSATWTEPGKEV